METKNEESVITTQPRSYQLGKIFWGLLFMLIGGLFLLHNFEVVRVDFGNLWRLWPLFIVAAGASMLSLRGWLGVLVSVALGTFILVAVLAAALGWWNPSSTATIKSVTVEKTTKDISEASITINGGAGRIDIGSNSDTDLVLARLKSNFTKLNQTSSVSGDKQNVSITLDAGDRWWRGNYENDLSVTLTESLPIRLRIDSGASDIHADLNNVDLRSLVVKSGASSSEFRLGSKSLITDIDIDIGVASLTLLLPKSSGISMRVDSGLSSRDTSGLREISDGYFESDNYSSARNKINIRGQLGMSNLDIRYY